jgi:hypothetical protein
MTNCNVDPVCFGSSEFLHSLPNILIVHFV